MTAVRLQDSSSLLFTDVELRVLQYLPTSLSFAAIAERLVLSEGVVRAAVVALYRKLGVVGRREAVEVTTSAREWVTIPYGQRPRGSTSGRTGRR